MKKQIWVTLQVDEQHVYRHYVGDVSDFDWQEQIESMANSIEEVELGERTHEDVHREIVEDERNRDYATDDKAF